MLCSLLLPDVADADGSRHLAARSGFAEALGLDDEEDFADVSVTDEALFPRACVDLPWKPFPL